jgi:hypothetical protein
VVSTRWTGAATARARSEAVEARSRDHVGRRFQQLFFFVSVACFPSRARVFTSAARVLLVCGAIPLPVKYLSAARSSPFQRIAAGPVDDPARALSRIDSRHDRSRVARPRDRARRRFQTRGVRTDLARRAALRWKNPAREAIPEAR